MTSNAGGRYVFDTNVIVSALLFSTSKPNRALLTALDRGAVLVSLALLWELQRVFNRPKFDHYITREEREQFLAVFARESVLVEVIEEIQICRDPKDDMVLNAAVNGSATCIVTGDADLLALHPFRDIPILTPDVFLTTYGDDEAAR